MIMSAVLAVALGLAPVKDSGSPQLVRFNEADVASQVGRYRQFTGKDGKTHLRGFDRLGRAYDIAVDANGHVEGEVGEWHVSYDVTDPA